ncbi:MAG: hypothetical protein ACHQF4_11160 [Sphingobacteriales bacterium]
MIDKNEKLKSYTERQTFWTTQALNQFGFSINFFLTISVAMIAFLIPQRKSYPPIKFCYGSPINWSLTIYIVVILLLGISILAGFISITSRLYDLRLTRFKIGVRVRTLKKFNELLPDDSNDLQNSKVNIHWNPFIAVKDIKQKINVADYEQIERIFIILKKQTQRLGELSWRAHITQIKFFILSTVVYIIFIFIN